MFLIYVISLCINIIRGFDIRLESTLNGHVDGVVSLKYLDKYGLLVSSSLDGTILVWNPANFSLLRNITNIDSKAIKMFDSFENILIGASGNSVKILNISTWKIEKILSAGKTLINSVKILNENQICGVSDDGKARIWDISKMNPIMIFDDHEDRTYDIELLNDEHFATSSRDKTINIWSNSRFERALEGHSGDVLDLELIHDGLLASASTDTTIKIWNPINGSLINTLTGHSNEVSCLKYLGNNLLASGSADNTLKIWNIETGELVTEILAHSKKITSIELISSSKLVTSSLDTTIKTWIIN